MCSQKRGTMARYRDRKAEVPGDVHLPRVDARRLRTSWDVSERLLVLITKDNLDLERALISYDTGTKCVSEITSSDLLRFSYQKPFRVPNIARDPFPKIITGGVAVRTARWPKWTEVLGLEPSKTFGHDVSSSALVSITMFCLGTASRVGPVDLACPKCIRSLLRFRV